jgi:hypothetical protein
MTDLAPTAPPKVEHLILCVRRCHTRWDCVFTMKEMKTVTCTLWIADLTFPHGMLAHLGPQEVEHDSDDEEAKRPHWKFWLEKRGSTKLALRGCADEAVMSALRRVVMKGTPVDGAEPFVEIADGDRFEMVRARGAADDGEEWISWEDAMSVVRIRPDGTCGGRGDFGC